MTMRNGITQKTSERMLIGPGAVYKDFTNPSTPGTLLGATIGGNVFSVEREFYTPEYDGALGPIKGSTRLVKEVPKITANLAEFTKENLLLALAGTSAADYGSPSKTHDKITSAGAVSAGNHNNAIAIVGERADSSTNPVCCVVKNALVTETVEVNTGTGKEDVVLKVTFTGYYLPESPGVPPYEIYTPSAA